MSRGTPDVFPCIRLHSDINDHYFRFLRRNTMSCFFGPHLIFRGAWMDLRGVTSGGGSLLLLLNVEEVSL